MQPSSLAAFAPEFSGNHVLLTFLGVMLDAFDAGLGWPRKNAIDVAALGAVRALPFIWIMERDAAGRFRYRLTGEEVRQNFGRSVKDEAIEDVIDSANIASINAIYRTLLRSPCICYSRGPAIGQRYAYIAERFIAPACDDDGQARFIVGCYQRNDVSESNAADRRATFDIEVARYIPLAALLG